MTRDNNDGSQNVALITGIRNNHHGDFIGPRRHFFVAGNGVGLDKFDLPKCGGPGIFRNTDGSCLIGIQDAQGRLHGPSAFIDKKGAIMYRDDNKNGLIINRVRGEDLAGRRFVSGWRALMRTAGFVVGPAIFDVDFDYERIMAMPGILGPEVHHFAEQARKQRKNRLLEEERRDPFGSRPMQHIKASLPLFALTLLCLALFCLFVTPLSMPELFAISATVFLLLVYRASKMSVSTLTCLEACHNYKSDNDRSSMDSVATGLRDANGKWTGPLKRVFISGPHKGRKWFYLAQRSGPTAMIYPEGGCLIGMYDAARCLHGMCYYVDAREKVMWSEDYDHGSLLSHEDGESEASLHFIAAWRDSMASSGFVVGDSLMDIDLNFERIMLMPEVYGNDLPYFDEQALLQTADANS